MQQTIAAIQEPLSRSHIAEQAKNTVTQVTIGRVSNMAKRAGETANRIATRTRRAAERLPRPIRDNPLPFALIGIGVAWLLARSQSHGDGWSRTDEWERGDYGNAGQNADYTGDYSRFSEYSEYRGHTADRGRSGMSGMTGRLGDIASDVGRRARRLGRNAQSRLSQKMRDNPMALGAVALAAGVLLGMMLPRTEVEDTYLGEARDSVVDSAREIAQDKVQQLSNAARDPSGDKEAFSPS
jgi:ElaB/YqjD/DUF883 family membrane-anchored ribosome-binding protein